MKYIHIYSKKEQCENCPHRDTCIGKGKDKARKLRVTTSAPIFYQINQEQKKPEFLEKYKKRSAQEWKNGEMKRFHGMSRARGWGLRSVTFQAKLTAIAVNLKRIAAISGEKTPLFPSIFSIFKRFQKIFSFNNSRTSFWQFESLKNSLFQWFRTVPCFFILNTPSAQEDAIRRYHKKLWSYIEYYNLSKKVTTKFNGIKVTQSGLLAACHLVGAYDVYEMFKTGEIKKDANGTSATYYMEKFAGYDLSQLFNSVG